MPPYQKKRKRYNDDEEKPITLSIRVPKDLAYLLGETAWQQRTSMSALIVEGVQLRFGLIKMSDVLPAPAILPATATATVPQEPAAAAQAPAAQEPATATAAATAAAALEPAAVPDMKPCRSGLHMYPVGLRECPECKRLRDKAAKAAEKKTKKTKRHPGGGAA